MRRPVQFSDRISRAHPMLRGIAREAVAKHGCEFKDAMQIALEAALRAEPNYDPNNASGASFETFIFTHAYGAVRRAALKDKNARLVRANALADALEFASHVGSTGDTYGRTDEQLNDQLDELRYGCAGAVFVGFAKTPSTPELDVIAAQRRAHILGVLRSVLEQLPATDREIVERHGIGGASLLDACASVPGWAGLAKTSAHRKYQAVLAAIGLAMWKRDVEAESVRGMLASEP